MKKWITVAAILFTSSLHALPWVETAQLTHSGGSASDYFGHSVAVDGDVAVIGLPFPGLAPHPSGVAYVFVRAGGVWNEAATLLPTVSMPDDDFGYSVAISGDTIVVGSPGAKTGTASVLSNEGLAFVFVRPPGGWAGTLTPTTVLYEFTTEGQTQPDRLGVSVAISGDTIASGAINAWPYGVGAVFVYTKPAGGWQPGGSLSPGQALVSSDGSGGDELGYSVGISGDTVVAGAPFASNGTLAGAGKAYVWIKPSYGWVGGYYIAESAELFPSDAIADGEFGFAAAIDGTTAVVTNQYGLTPTQHDKGYVFVQPSTGWAGTLNENAQLLGSGVIDAFEFGSSASISGDSVVIGAPFADTPFSSSEGVAYVFNRPSSGWSGPVGQFARIYRGSGPSADAFGLSVAISGTTILVGAPGETIDGNPSQGAAHVFEPGLNPTITAAFSPGSVLTFQPSTLQFLVFNPNASGFLSDVSFADSLPSGLFVDATPNVATSCNAVMFAPPGSSLILSTGAAMMAGWTCGSDVNVSSGIPGTYTTATYPVQCDQGCDGAGSNVASLLVRLRATQTRFLVQGPIRVAPGVPVEFSFHVDPLRESPTAPTGEVVVSDGAGHTCRSDVSVSGEGSCSLTFGSPGTFRVRAQYLGNLSFGGSTSPAEPVLVGSPGGAP